MLCCSVRGLPPLEPHTSAGLLTEPPWVQLQTLWTRGQTLFFIMLSRLIIVFPPRSKCLLSPWLQSLSTVILEPQKIKCHCFYFSPSICHGVMGPDATILVFLMLSFQPAFSLSSFTIIRGSLVPLRLLPLEWYHMSMSFFLGHAPHRS